MNAGKIVESITDACEPYSDGEPDLYDLPIYVNGRMVSSVKIVPADKFAGDRIELLTDECRLRIMVMKRSNTYSDDFGWEEYCGPYKTMKDGEDAKADVESREEGIFKLVAFLESEPE